MAVPWPPVTSRAKCAAGVFGAARLRPPAPATRDILSELADQELAAGIVRLSPPMAMVGRRGAYEVTDGDNKHVKHRDFVSSLTANQFIVPRRYVAPCLPAITDWASRHRFLFGTDTTAAGSSRR